MYYVDEIMGTSWLPPSNSILVVYIYLLPTAMSPVWPEPELEHNTWPGSPGSRLAVASQAAQLSPPCAKSPGCSSGRVRPSWLARYSGPGAPDLSFSCPGAVSFPRTVLMAGHTWDTAHLHASPAFIDSSAKLKENRK